MDMYDRLQTNEFLPLVNAVIRGLENSEIEGYEADRCSSALEQLCLSLLPIGLLEDAKRVLSSAIATMLTDYGGSLSLDDIQSVTKSLFEFGVNEDAASKASYDSLTGYIENLSETLDELGSVSELERYTKDLKRAMNEFGIVDLRVDSRLESRMDKLIEKEGQDDGESYGGTRSTAPNQISNDEIRSMFSGLRSE